MITIKNPRTVNKYLSVLYEVDVLTSKQIAYLLGLSSETVVKFLSDLKKKGCVIDIHSSGSHYWHLLPRGVMVLEAIIGKPLPTYSTTIPQNSKGKSNQNTRHNVHCSNKLMALVESSVQSNCGLWLWNGPTYTRTLHMTQRDGEPFKRTTLHPDALIGFYQEGKYGRMYVEYDSGVQYAATIETKVRKAHTTLNLYRGEKDDIVIGFITHGGEKRRQNIMNSLKLYMKERKNPITVAIACEKDILEGCGWDKIWITNKHDGPVSFKSLGIYCWDQEISPSTIGFGTLCNGMEIIDSNIILDEVQEA
jgi:biotin operon repressor